jgi:hypothetical protein
MVVRYGDADSLSCSTFRISSQDGNPRCLVSGDGCPLRKVVRMRFIDEVCNLFDVEVLCDIEPVADRVKWEVRYKPTLALGSRSDEVSFIMTPWFTSLEDLDAFLERHIATLRTMVGDDVPAPNMVGWA